MITDIPIDKISGVSTKYHRLLNEAGIITDGNFLAKTPEELANILKVSHGTALNLYAQPARRIIKKD